MTVAPKPSRRPAPLGRRLLAFALDAVIGGLPFFALTGLLLGVWIAFLGGRYWGWPGVEEALAGISEARFYALFAAWLAAALAGLIWLVGYGLLRDSFGDGQSWGKRLLGLRVVHAGLGRPCGRKESLLRNLPGVASVVASILLPFVGWLLLVVEPLAVVTSPARLRIGDRWAGTHVVLA